MIRRQILPLLVILLALSHATLGQEQTPLSVETIFGPEAMQAQSLPTTQWLSDGTVLMYDRRLPAAERTLERIDPASGKRTPLVDAQRALAAMRRVLGEERTPKSLPMPAEIDRGGTRGLYLLEGDLYLLEFDPLVFVRLTQTPEEEKCLSFSPDGGQIGFVRSNDLYVIDCALRSERRVTTDGTDSLLNGTLSWVYWEEVFGRKDTGYWWSEDSRSIAFFQTDESGVSVQVYPDIRPWTPRVIRQRYPKVGEKNPTVRLGIAELASGRITWAKLDSVPHEYVVRATWLPDNRRLAVETMTRLQTTLDLLLVDAATGESRRVLAEHDSGWVNIVDDLYFLKKGSEFLWSSERTGYKHLYRYALDGRLLNPVTRGEWSMRASGGPAWVDRSVVAVDERDGWVYFTALEKSSIERHLYRVRFDGSAFTRLTKEDGTHAITFSEDGKYYLDRYSSINTAPVLRLHRSDGTFVRELAAARAELLAGYGLQHASFLTVPARDGFPLPAQIVKPRGFDPSKKYPVIFFVYGGPSAPQVTNAWQRDVLWENLLAQNGFLVVRVDPRSATGISKKLENLGAYHILSDLELNDLVDAVRYFKGQSYVDPARCGIWGWSGGGTYTMLAMTRSTEFAAGIAVAGVTDHRFYDTKWAEAGMKTERENREGFEHTSLLRTAKDLHGRLMIVHGTYDDNVHIQNAWRFIDELIRANKHFDLMVYPMRQHGIADPPARLHLYSTMLEFWKRNL